MTEMLFGPRRAPAAGGPADTLIVLLHGCGADGSDLIEAAGPLGAVLPHAAFTAPDAPQPYDMASDGRQWFSLQSWEPADLTAGADRAAPVLSAFIEAELKRHGLDHSRLVLWGFSQGMMMALHVGLRMQPAPAAIVGISGLLVAPERLAAERGGDVPVLLVHGTADDIVPFARHGEALAALSDAGIMAESCVCPGLGHAVNATGFNAAAAFLERHLGQG